MAPDATEKTGYTRRQNAAFRTRQRNRNFTQMKHFRKSMSNFFH